MSVMTTRSPFLLTNALGGRERAEGASNSFNRIVENLRNAWGVANNMISDNDDDLNYTMSLYNNIYVLDNPLKIKEFLKSNKYLVPLVSDAHHELKRFFPHSPLSMKVYQNELVVSVLTSLSPEDADEKLDSFDEAWWIDAYGRSNARLCITVEFQ